MQKKNKQHFKLVIPFCFVDFIQPCLIILKLRLKAVKNFLNVFEVHVFDHHQSKNLHETAVFIVRLLFVT